MAEGGWGRGVDFLRLTTEEINALIASSGHQANDSSLLLEGHANTNYLLDLTEGSRAVLRIYQRDAKSAGLELSISTKLAGALPVPHVLGSDLGNWTLFEWMPGTTVERLLSNDGDTEVLTAAWSIGEALAKMSKITFDKAGFLDDSLQVYESWPSAADGLFDYFEFLLDQDLVQDRAGAARIDRLRPIATEGREQFKVLGEPPCLTHGDYKATNLLVHEGHLSGILDWEFAHSGTWLMSAGQIFRHPLPEGFEEGFVAGFASAGGKPFPEWRGLARKVDLLSMLDFLNRPSSNAARISGVLKIVDATLNE